MIDGLYRLWHRDGKPRYLQDIPLNDQPGLVMANSIMDGRRTLALTNDLSVEERQQVLQELKTIMSVYDKH